LPALNRGELILERLCLGVVHGVAAEGALQALKHFLRGVASKMGRQPVAAGSASGVHGGVRGEARPATAVQAREVCAL
jgi:hypothetical protein